MAKRCLASIPFCSAAKIGRLWTPGNVLTVMVSAPCARLDPTKPSPKETAPAELAARPSNSRRVVTSRMTSSPALFSREFKHRRTCSFLQPPAHPPRIAAREIAVARQRPERKIFRIAVIAQIKHARETGGGVAGVVSENRGALRVWKKFYCARPRRGPQHDPPRVPPH